jgi:hypothetical protein
MRVLVVAASLAAATAALSVTPVRSAAASCSATPVHFGVAPTSDPGLRALPWIAAGRGRSRVSGYLFYYPSVLADARVNRSAGLTIYTGGTSPSRTAMKILWVPRQSGPSLRVSARRLDAPGSFVQTLPRAGGGIFPSVIRIPQAGCWRLTLSGRGVRTSIVVSAVDPPSTSACDASPVRGEDDAVATPAGAGIIGKWSWRTSDGRALLYARGRGPGGVNMKVLWVVRRRWGRTLQISGQRLDAAGSFRQTFPMAGSPVGTFPSIIEVPDAGCWALTVRTGRLGGVLVVKVVEGR